MQKLKEFGFECGEFDVVAAADGSIIPGSRATLKRHLLPTIKDLNEAAGWYTLHAYQARELICKIPVHVLWAAPIPPREMEPFLMLRSSEPSLIDTLRAFKGKPVSLKFKLIGDGSRMAR